MTRRRRSAPLSDRRDLVEEFIAADESRVDTLFRSIGRETDLVMTGLRSQPELQRGVAVVPRDNTHQPAEWLPGNLTPLRYRVIVADPPWRFRTWGEHNQQKSASKHYALMRTEEIEALPVNQLAGPDCMLVMWAVQPMLDKALSVMKAWASNTRQPGLGRSSRAPGAAGLLERATSFVVPLNFSRWYDR